MAVDGDFRLVCPMAPSVEDKISMQPSRIDSGADNVAAITGSDVSIANGCLGRYLRTAPVLTVTLHRLGERCLIQKIWLCSEIDCRACYDEISVLQVLENRQNMKRAL